MLRQVKRSLPNKELHKIAKTIQWYYKRNLASNFKKAFDYTTYIAGSDLRYKTRLAIENSLNPSNKFYSSEEIEKLLASAGIYNDQANYRYITFLTRFKLPSLKIIKADLNVLINDFEGIEFSEDGLLTAEMGPFNLEGIEFGNFQVRFHMGNFCLLDIENSPSIYPVTPNYPKGEVEKRHSHPHVRGRGLCLGAGQGILNKAMTGARLQDCFEIVKSVLSTYNHKDPYASIIRWKGEKCRTCDDYYYKKDSSCCNKCGEIYCKNCVRQCCLKSEIGPVCHGCVTAQYKCKHCGRVMCSECVVVCEHCNKNLCTGHIKINYHRCRKI